MFKDHANIMNAIASAGEVTGRKKLQKMIYIAKRISFPFQEKFQFHFYGPYSEELTLRVEELCNLGYLHENKEKKSGYFQYRYTLTPSGEEFLKHYEMDMPALQPCMLDMNEQSARFLELVSTVLYFYELSKEEVTEKIHTLKSKQKYTLEEIDEAYEYIVQIEEKAKLQ
ncbi:YwgA family protein [Peribacillus deserti]|uniref:YwgA family protein n=1 Tax=Peribacillus deserti TaxID=673318 RepID=A0A2N5M7C2_9BACI|nr:hypothetical protein [Peribacillus deserti]PLT30247.1 hypothetical protein CUU66_08450 [Peribacillus deserti]